MSVFGANDEIDAALCHWRTRFGVVSTRACSGGHHISPATRTCSRRAANGRTIRHNRERRVLARFRSAAIRLFVDHDRDLDGQIGRYLHELPEDLGKLPFRDGFNKVAQFRDLFVMLADRHQASEPRWRRMAAEFEEILEEGFYEILAVYRRFAVKQLLRGRWTADEGREFLHWVDVEHSAGRCSLEQFGEFVVALDLAEQRAF